MKILQLVKKYPYPPKDGESIAVLSSSRGYAKLGCEISLLSMNTKKHFVEDTSGNGIKHYKSVHTSYLDNDINLVDAIFNLFSKKSFNIKRFNCNLFHEKLKTILEKQVFDVIHLESLYMLPYISTIKKYSSAMIVYRSHNLEHEIWANLAESNKNPFLKWYFNLCSKRLLEFELNNFDNYDILLPISSSDYQKYKALGYQGEILLSPVGIDMHYYKAIKTKINNNIKVGYIGSLDWKPNIEGLNWFFKNIWSKTITKFNNLEFHLAGRNPDKSLENLNVEQLIKHGEVDSAKDFLENLDLIIVPLLSGSGIRIKILESMAMGKVVLSTAKGFEGINIENGKDGFIFSNAKEFEMQLEKLIGNQELILEISNNAKKFIQENFDYIKLAQTNLDTFKDIKNIKQ